MARLVLTSFAVNEWEEKMRERTRRFALDVIRFVRLLPDDCVTQPLKRQLLRSACGIAANYRGACRARSHAEFVARIGIVLDEADESEGWLDMMHDAGVSTSPALPHLRRESKELRAIFFAANRTARRRASIGTRS